MALRMMVYLGLLYQDLAQRRELTPSGKLPPVLPLVLYNGHAPWGAAQEIASLIEEVPGGLQRYRPQMQYCLLDEMRMVDSELASLRNVAAALFRLEKSRGPEDIQRILAALIEWLWEPDLAELRRSFAAWLTGVLLPARVPGIAIAQVADLQEVKSMLAESVMEWTHQWKQEGLEAGRQEGQEDALAKARGILVRDLERRFGALTDEVRRRVDAIASIEELTEFVFQAGAASSLNALVLS